MRPQRNAGENTGASEVSPWESESFNEAPAKCRGKLHERPRRIKPIASFNEAPAKCRGKPKGQDRIAMVILKGFNEAPAKCRGKPSPMGSERRGESASMRPQRNAGENQHCHAVERSRKTRFNEAPAKCRGKLPNQALTRICNHCFNEAPAKCRGKRRQTQIAGLVGGRFNEAPAKCRGKLNMSIDSGVSTPASMRPQRNAGENPSARA